MAMESACKLQVGKEHYDGEVRMEGDHIDFAGQTKYRFRLTEIRHPRREADTVTFDFHGNQVSIKLDAVSTAENWIEYILNPQTLADKLGAKDGQVVRILNLEDQVLQDSLRCRGCKLVAQPADGCDLVMLGVERSSELRQLEDLSETLGPGGAIWVVLPKTGRLVTKANVLANAREAGLLQVEVIDYSEAQAAYKIIRPHLAAKRARSIATAHAATSARRAPLAQS